MDLTTCRVACDTDADILAARRSYTDLRYLATHTVRAARCKDASPTRDLADDGTGHGLYGDYEFDCRWGGLDRELTVVLYHSAGNPYGGRDWDTASLRRVAEYLRHGAVKTNADVLIAAPTLCNRRISLYQPSGRVFHHPISFDPRLGYIRHRGSDLWNDTSAADHRKHCFAVYVC